LLRETDLSNGVDNILQRVYYSGHEKIWIWLLYSRCSIY
jgi:hypothetical protein